MAKKKISNYVFEPGISKDLNLYPNAVALIAANKAFLQAQVVAFINYNITNNIAPYAGYTYASSKCVRDVGYFIDAILHDLRYGGNVKCRQISDYFWINGEPMIRGDVSPEITGQQYLRDIINNFILTNTTVTPSYGQTSVPQVKITGAPGESGAPSRNTTLWNIFGTVISNGTFAIPAKVPGVSSIRLLGNYQSSEILLITNTNTGEILYNFADPLNTISFEYKQGRSSGNGELLSDVDFSAWWHTTDTITTINLSTDTSSLTSSTDLQIFVEEPYQTIRPWDFGTDAIERIRVSNPQAMLDADFEYGLQPTKWQALGLIRSYPSLYEVPGTDLAVTAITTDASINTSGFGSSLITVTTSGSHGFTAGQPITVKGLLNTVQGFARAEGSFLVNSVPSANSFTYYSAARVGTVFDTSLYTSTVQIRQANYYTGSAIGTPTFSIFSNGSTATVTSKFNTSSSSTSIAYTGSVPTTGSPITGSASIPIGTSISGIIGSIGTVTATVLNSVNSGSSTTLSFVDLTGIQQGMAIESGTGSALFINSLVGNTAALSGPLGFTIAGLNGTNVNLNGSNVQSIGTNATFKVNYANNVYTVTEVGDSSANGENYAQGDVLTISGTDLGGVTPTNDVIIRITEVDSGGSIVTFTYSGSAPAGIGNYSPVLATNATIPGSGAVFSITRTNGSYSAVVATTLGSNYAPGNRIIVSGTGLDGTSPANDCTITVLAVNESGGITSAQGEGVTFTGNTITVYPALTLSDALTGSIPDSTSLTVGAIATCQIDFANPHGIVPGTTMFNYITSQPTPLFSSTAQTMASSQTWTGVAFANGRFVAVASGTNATAYSTNGRTWVAGGNLPANTAWTSIAAGQIGSNYYFVAVASGASQAAYSLDGGATWQNSTLPSAGTWTSVAYYSGVFVAVRSGSNAGAYSIDGGVNWVASTLPSSSAWTDVAGGLVGTSVYFVAVASGGTAAGYSADGGVTWAATGALPTSSNWSSIAFGNNRFFAIARGSTAGATSIDGTAWTAVTLPTSANWNSVIFGDENFVAVADGGTQCLTSFNASTGSWTDRTLSANATWEEIAYGFIPGTGGIFTVVGNAQNASSIVLTSANHQLAAGPFVITEVPSPTTLRYPARSIGTIDTTVPLAGTVYVRPDSFFQHRPFDGGVQLGTGGPSHGAQAIRQSKKYIRYQSGKGMMYTTGALFAPSYNLSAATATDYTVNSLITFTCDDTDHGLQPGAIVEIIGMVSFEYNAEYTVESIVDSRSFRVRTAAVLSTLTAQLGPEAKVVLKKWRGATVRIGAFDEQNGIFYQYDGQEMSVVRRSSTLQLTGTVSATVESNVLTGTNTRFQDQLVVGDKIVLRGMSHTVTSITNQTTMTVAPDWRGANNITGAKICLTEDLVIPQRDWNLDRLDGTGPSGYNFLPTRMQMIGIQYTWYAAGFIEFMLRGADGKFVFFHRMRNSNVNTEAYMRTANLPVRYEIENVSAKNKLKTAMSPTSTSLTLYDANKFPTNGIVYIDNELISYTGKTGNTLTGLSRAATMTNYASGLNRTYSAGPASTHNVGSGVVLVDVTCSPTISHWGSALLTDGQFDSDRGYIFNYAATGVSVSTTRQTAFMIRLAPSVSNAIVGDLGERDLLNRAQLLLQEIAITADSGSGGIVIEGVLNPRNYPTNPANITWNGLSSSGSGGQPSFAQIALGGSINWGGASVVTTTATVQGALTTTTTARAFNTVQQTITARSVANGTYDRAISNNRSDFLITDSDYVSLTSTPLRIGDTLSANQVLQSGQAISSITRNYLTFGGTSYTRIVMTSNGSQSSNQGNTVNVTVTNIISTTYSRAFNTGRVDFLLTDADVTSSGLLVGDTLSSVGFVTGNQTISSITSSYARVGGTNYARIVMSNYANGNSNPGSNISVTVQAANTAASYTGNFVFFTNSSWNSSGAGVGTRISPSFTNLPAGTSVASVATRSLSGVTVRRVTFTQSATTPIAAAGTVTFQFGDPPYALPGEQVFSFITNPGGTTSLDLSQLKELTTTAIGGRGTFPNGPDVLAINIYKISGTATPTSIVLRWGEAQA